MRKRSRFIAKLRLAKPNLLRKFGKRCNILKTSSGEVTSRMLDFELSVQNPRRLASEPLFDVY